MLGSAEEAARLFDQLSGAGLLRRRDGPATATAAAPLGRYQHCCQGAMPVLAVVAAVALPRLAAPATCGAVPSLALGSAPRGAY